MVRLFILLAVISGMGVTVAAQELAVTKYQATITVHAYPRTIYDALPKATLGNCFNSPVRADWTYCFSHGEIESQFPKAKAEVEAKKKEQSLVVPVEIREAKPQTDASNAATADYVSVQINNN